MNTNTFLQGISRVLNCPKVHVTAAGLLTTWFAVRYAAGDLPPTQRASLWVAFIGAVAVELREIVNAWTEVDVAGVERGSVGEGEKGRIKVEPSLSGAVQASAGGAALGLQSSLVSTDINSGRNDMGSTTKILSVAVGFSVIALFAAGCQTPAEVTVYREGLHQVDEPLYQAHLLLMNDAVKANLRTDADRQVVQKGIDAAEGLYQQSKETEGSGVVASQPAKP